MNQAIANLLLNQLTQGSDLQQMLGVRPSLGPSMAPTFMEQAQPVNFSGSFTGNPGAPPSDLHDLMGAPQRNPQFPTQEAPEPDKNAQRMEALKDEAWRMATGEQIKRPDMKLRWNEVLAASLNPKLLPFIFQNKMEPYHQEMEGRKSRMDSLKTLLDIYEPKYMNSQAGIMRFGGGQESMVPGTEPPVDQQKAFAFDPEHNVINPNTGDIMFRGTPSNKPLIGSPGSQFVDPNNPNKVLHTVPFKPSSANRYRIPAAVQQSMADMGINPLEPGEAGFQQWEEFIKLRPGRIDPKIAAEARKRYVTASQHVLDAITFGDAPTPEQQAQADAIGTAAFQSYVKQFGKQTPAEPPLGLTPGQRIQWYMDNMKMTKDQAMDAEFSSSHGAKNVP